MLSKIVVLWIVFAAAMGFALGGSFVSAWLVPQAALDQSCANGEQTNSNCDTPEKRHETAEAALAYYTKWLMFFTAGMAAATVGLGIATIGLYLAGEKAVEQTRRIGEAQVRAYVSIKVAMTAFWGTWQHPLVRFVAFNTGQSPARNFIWNITLQYASGTNQQTNCIDKQWRARTGVDIPAASDSPMEGAMIPNMSLRDFRKILDPTVARGVVIRVKIDFRFTDVFGQHQFGEAYSTALGQRVRRQRVAGSSLRKNILLWT